MTPKRRTIDARWSAVEMYPHRHESSAQDIERDVRATFPTLPYATHGSVCADLLRQAIENSSERRYSNVERDRTIQHVHNAWAGLLVGRILVYSENVKNAYGEGRRQPKPMNAQLVAFKRNLYAVWREALRAAQTGVTGVEPVIEPVASTFVPVPVPEPEPVGSTCPMRAHHDWSVKVARIFEKHGKSYSYRGCIDGIAMIAEGCDPRAIRDSCLMEYPDDIREQCGVLEPFDFSSIDVLDYLTKAAKARVVQRGVKRPVCLALIGPAGTGKTTLTEILAERLEMDYYDLSMSAGTPLSAFYGRESLDGTVRTSQFEQWARNGGLHLWDEMDCAEPNLLKVCNKILANRSYTNPLTGEKIIVSENAVAIAAMNTTGTGVQTEYSAAEQIDFSTSDRFRAGRMRLERDYKKEAEIVDSMIAGMNQ